MKIELKILNKEFYGKGNHPGDVLTMKNTLEYREDGGKLPRYQTPGSAAIDLVATQDYTIHPGEVVEIRTGLALHIGSGLNQSDTPEIVEGINRHMGVSFAGLILPRSGLGADGGLVLGNLVGLLDEDYQGELKVKVWNRNKTPDLMEPWYMFHEKKSFEEASKIVWKDALHIKAGDRFAQLMFIPIIKPTFEIVEEFSSFTYRGDGGFNSTGNK